MIQISGLGFKLMGIIVILLTLMSCNTNYENESIIKLLDRNLQLRVKASNLELSLDSLRSRFVNPYRIEFVSEDSQLYATIYIGNRADIDSWNFNFNLFDPDMSMKDVIEEDHTNKFIDEYRNINYNNEMRMIYYIFNSNSHWIESELKLNDTLFAHLMLIKAGFIEKDLEFWKKGKKLSKSIRITGS